MLVVTLGEISPEGTFTAAVTPVEVVVVLVLVTVVMNVTGA